ncbi:GTPase-activating protein AGE1 [Lachancea thermotolerans CBS 6340]|uniref:ADP-ribosylation factor GTPase-activating protein n=1 Tax=Lachancea thermotolerans (strain ATCC 56472 / CBS 6340 / NRRL Y-8284) TaxID=559295 RepID=C5DK11_LACTC|nr:KLTH0F00924p [Lachancea thermotolerans CBS 6340]CAR23812.1 KLTH0F00924p [Lachancea thermotolerans CBS 6340]
MGSNTSLLARCGDARPGLVAVEPDGGEASLKFTLVDYQLALQACAAPTRYRLTVRHSGPASDLRCGARNVRGSPSYMPLPVQYLSAGDPNLVSASVSIAGLLESPGLYTVEAVLCKDTVFSAAVLIERPQKSKSAVLPTATQSHTKPQAEQTSQPAHSSSTESVPRTEASLQKPGMPPSPRGSPAPFTFPPDGPQFRTLIAQCEGIVPQLRTDLKMCLERSSRVCDLLAAATKELTGLISNLQSLDTFSPSLSPHFHKTVTALRSSLSSQSQSLSRLACLLQNHFNTPAHTYVTSLDSKQLASRHKIYHDQAKLFYSYMGKNLSSADSANLSKKIQFELHRLDFFIYLTGLFNGPAARKLIYEWSRFPSSVFPNSSSSALLLQETAQYQSDFKARKAQMNAQREKISRSRSFSDFSAQVSTQSHKVFKEGILWTYKGHGKSSGWHKQWVVLKDSTLSEYSDWKTQGKKLSHPPLSLTFACIKRHESGNYNAFEIITTTGVTRAFRAESKSDLDQWVQLLQIAVGLGTQTPSPEEESDTLTPLSIVASVDNCNKICCDCGGTSQVEWISINLLCVICIKCSAVHRSLGSHISKVRSLKLDSFTSKEILELLKFVSNKNLNSIYEAELPKRQVTSDSSNEERTAFISDKYVKKRYVSPLQEQEPEAVQKRLHHNLIKSIHLNSIYLLQQCLAQGVDINSVKLDNGETVFQYSLQHYMGTKTEPIFFITEFLLLNGLQVGRLPRDASSLSKTEYNYWKSKAETNGVYSTKPLVRSATTRETFKSMARIDTSGPSPPQSRQASSASETSDSGSKRWSIGGAMTLSSPVSASLSTPKSRNIKFPKLHGGKSH